MHGSYTKFSSHISTLDQRQCDSSYDQRKSLQINKQVHMNPLKIKTSFLRQSIVNGTELNHNVLRITPKKDLTNNEYEIKQDLMLKKILQKFNPSKQYKVNTSSIEQFREIKQINNPKHQNFDNKRYYQKQNMISYSSSNNKEKLLTRILNDNTNNFKVMNNTSALSCNQVQKTNNASSNQQLNVILKKLAKLQCQIQTIKRQSQADDKFQHLSKQLKLQQIKYFKFQSKFQQIQRKILQFEHIFGPQNKNKEIEQKINSIQNSLIRNQVNIKNQIQKLEKQISSIKLQQNEKTNKLIQKHKQETKLQHIRQQVNQKLKTQIQNLNKNVLQKIKSEFLNKNIRLQSQIENKFKHLNENLQRHIKSNENLQRHIKQNNKDKNNQINNQTFRGVIGDNKCHKVSLRKCHTPISLVYQQILRVNNKIQKSSLPIETQQLSNYSSDRSKLLFNALNFSANSPHKLSSIGSISPQKSQINNYNSGQIQTNKNVLSTLNYCIDGEGYLLDQKGYYIVDQTNSQIKLDVHMIELLKIHHVLS